MQRRDFVTALAAAVLIAPMAQADTLTDRIERQLRAQGFNRMTVSRTWLGRTRILATSKTQSREIILNPRTGEILRDYWQPLPGAGQVSASDDILDSRNATKGAAEDGKGSDSGSSGSEGSSGGDGGGDNGGSDGGDNGGDSGGDGGSGDGNSND